MLDCYRVTQLCSAEQDRRLDLGERFGLGLHTLHCTACRNFRRQMKFLRQATQRYADGAALPDEGAADHAAPR